jgi:integrase
MKRHATNYPGVFYREGTRIGGKGIEKIFYVVYKKEGKTHEEKAGRQFADDMSPARAAGIRSELIEGKRLPRKKIRAKKKAKVWTVNALWESYKETHPENKGLALENSRFKRNIEGGIGKKKPSDLVPLDVDRLRLKLQKAGKHTTAVRVLELLRRTINYGVNRNLMLPINFKIVLPRLNNQVTEDLTAEQMTKLLSTLEKDEDQLCANLMRLALYTGMRRGELFKLKWKDIDTERGFIRIKDPKGGPDQTIPLNDAAHTIFESIPKHSRNPYVFPGKKKDTHLNDMRKSITRIKKNAGLPSDFRPLHGLRHVYASMLASSGKVDLYTLQKLLTHKSPQMTQRYAHLRDGALKRASNLAGSIIDEAQVSNSARQK